MRLNQRGVTIIEVVAACGLLGLAFAATLAISVYGIKSWGSLNNRSSATGLANELRSALQNRNNCELNFKDLAISLGANPVIPEIRKVEYFSGGDQVTGTIIDLDKTRIEFKPSSIRLIPNVNLPNNQMLANLDVSNRDPGPNEVMLQRSIPMLLDIEAGKIKSCIAGLDANLELHEKSCGIGSDGTSHWDSVSQSCVGAELEWADYDGDYTNASCPGDWELFSWSCWSRAPVGFVDTYVPTTRYYSDGTIDNTPVEPYRCNGDETTKVCTCNYAADIDSTGFVAVASCHRRKQ